MRLNINLATQPYQDVKRYILRWGVPLLLFALVSTWFCWRTLHTWMHSRDVNTEIARVKSEIKALDDERAGAEALLARPENRTAVEQSRELNELIARKSFSWTGIFMQLEKIMPSQLHVLQISPELNKQNQIQLRLLVAGTNREQAVELVRRLEQSPNFSKAQLRAETMQPDSVQFEIAALYIPHPPEATAGSAQRSTEPQKGATETQMRSAVSTHNGKAAR